MRGSIRKSMAVAALCAVAAALAPVTAQEALVPVQRRGRNNAPKPPAAAPEHERTSRDVAEEGMRLFHGSSDGILALAFSPDGKTLASACADRSITLWDVATGTATKKLEGHTSGVSALAFSPDGKRLASGGFDAAIDIWNLKDGAIEDRIHDSDGPVLHLAFASDSRRVAWAWGADMRIWDLDRDALAYTCTCDGPVGDMLCTPAGEVVTADHGAGLIVWDPKTGKQTVHFSRPRATRWMTKDEDVNWMQSVAQMGDGRLLISDVSGMWTLDRKSGKFTLIGKNLYNLVGPIAHDQFYCGGNDGHALWIRDIRPEGISLMMDVPFKIHAVAISPKGDCVAFSGGGEWTPESYWRTAGPMDIRVLQVDSIVSAMAMEKGKKEEWLKSVEETQPDAVLDQSAIYAKDGVPLPWKTMPLTGPTTVPGTAPATLPIERN